MYDSFREAWEETASCCGETLFWTWNEDDLRFEAECSCQISHYLKPTDADYSMDETEDVDEY